MILYQNIWTWAQTGSDHLVDSLFESDASFLFSAYILLNQSQRFLILQVQLS